LGRGSSKDLAKTYGSKRGKKEVNTPRKPEGWNELAQQECGQNKARSKKRCGKWTSESINP